MNDIKESKLKSIMKLPGTQALLGLVIILVAFSILSPTFRSLYTFSDIAKQATVLGILACGTTLVLISGGLDLSVGSILALVSVSIGSFLAVMDLPVPVAITLGLLVGASCGFLNGLLQVWTGVPPFIITLGGLMVYRGAAELLGAGKDLSGFPGVYESIGTGYWVPIGILIIAMFLIWLFLSKTTLGFHCFAIGGSEEVARLSGVKVKRNRIIYYTLGGMMAALAAVIQTSRLGYANSSFGQMWELYAIAAVVIGGTSLFGGVGGVGRTIIGVLIIQSIRVGLSHMGIGSSRQKIAIGIIIVLAVWLDVYQRRRAEKA